MARTGFTRSQTGKASAFGGARTRGTRSLAPWGTISGQKTARGANASGVTRSTVRSPGRNLIRLSTPALSERSMSYPTNDPLAWPVEGGNFTVPLSGMTQAKADFNNNAVNFAYQRAGYPNSYNLENGSN